MIIDMNKEKKELLLKDLCARLPYGTRVRYTYAFAGVAGINEYSDEGTLSYDKLQDFSLPNVGYERRRVIYILSYLRPMSSMNTNEKREYAAFIYSDSITVRDMLNLADWLNAHYFDYRDLIEKGLALEAPEGMYNIK